MYFLAGVADAEIFKNNESFATAKTLIDSSITIGVSAEDIRAGKGAKLYGKYFHTSTFDLKLSDAMFKLEYLAANVGAELELGGDVFRMKEYTLAEDGETVDLEATAKPMTAGGKVYVYYKKATEDYFRTAVLDNDDLTKFTIPGGKKDEVYCVKYLYTNESARKVTVNANFIPDTLSIYLTANLYSGDVNDISTGTKAGQITIKVPRFLLSGSQEIAMSMTGAANTPLEGSALATKGEGCDGEGIYAEIIEIIEGRTYNDLVRIKISADEDGISLVNGETKKIEVYGSFSETRPMLLNNQLLSFSLNPSDNIVKIDNEGILTPISNGTVELEVTAGNENVVDVVIVNVYNMNEDPDEPEIYENPVTIDENGTVLMLGDNYYLQY